MTELTQARLKELLHYDAETGIFTRKKTHGAAKEGRSAGWLDAYGYLCIQIDKRAYKSHRLAWLYMTGEWPKNQIDHRNQVKIDNKFKNLRQATHCENMRNMAFAKKNLTGFRGVSRVGNRFQAKITVNGIPQYIGLYLTPEDASFAREVVAKSIHGEFYKEPAAYNAVIKHRSEAK